MRYLHHFVRRAGKTQVYALSFLIFVQFVVIFGPHQRLHRRKSIERSRHTIIVQQFLEISLILLRKLIILLFRIFDGLLLRIVYINRFV